MKATSDRRVEAFGFADILTPRFASLLVPWMQRLARGDDGFTIAPLVMND